MIATLYFESDCKHCNTQTVACAMSIPEGLDIEYLGKMVRERENDCCYTCYQLVEQDSKKIIIK